MPVGCITHRRVTYTATLLHPSDFQSTQATAVSGNAQVGGGRTPSSYSWDHALVWNGTSNSWLDLTPPGFNVTIATGVAGGSQVGTGQGPVTADASHALLWHGSPNSFVDLNPNGFITTIATGLDASSQVGFGGGPATDNYQHALLWHNTADSVVDLNPAGFWQSTAMDVDGDSQVGDGTYGISQFLGRDDHALLWHGTADSVVDLHPPGFEFYTRATGVSGNSQVGYGRPVNNDYPHALLWHGTADSVVDLHPAGFTESVARDVAGDLQVGWGDNHALLWHGTADSVVDLHPFLAGLGPNFIASVAQGVDEHGNIVGYAYYTVDAPYDEPTGRFQAVLWTPVPEPASALLCTTAIALGALRRRRS